MADETQEDVEKTQKAIKHNGNKIKISLSTNDSEVEVHDDTGEYGSN